MNQKDDSFIDKTFTVLAETGILLKVLPENVLAEILLKVLPASKEEKQAFSYYRYGMAAQSSGDYAEALENYFEALKLEEDPFDRSYILYNIGLIYSNKGSFLKSLKYYHQALELNSKFPQALNNIASIYHYQGTKATERGEFELARDRYVRASTYWNKAIRLAPNSYIEAQNWLKITGRTNKEAGYRYDIDNINNYYDDFYFDDLY